MPKLIVHHGTGTAAVIDLDGAERIRLGRAPDNDVVMKARMASRAHAVIERRDAGYLLRDTDSFNGTFVNDKPVRETWLRDGDEIRIASYLIRFAAGPGPAAPPVPADSEVTPPPELDSEVVRAARQTEDDRAREAFAGGGTAVLSADAVRAAIEAADRLAQAPPPPPPPAPPAPPATPATPARPGGPDASPPAPDGPAAPASSSRPRPAAPPPAEPTVPASRPAVTARRVRRSKRPAARRWLLAAALLAGILALAFLLGRDEPVAPPPPPAVTAPAVPASPEEAALGAALGQQGDARLEALWALLAEHPDGEVAERAYLALLDGGATPEIVCDHLRRNAPDLAASGRPLAGRCGATP